MRNTFRHFRLAPTTLGFAKRRSLVAFAAAALVVACGSSDEAPPTSEPSTTAPAGLCATIAELPSRCAGAESSTCDATLASTCDSLLGILSPALTDAAATCVREAPCGTSPWSCFASSLGSLTMTAAQTALVDAYCSECMVAGGDACKAAFAGEEAASNPVAKLIAPLGDDLANAIAETCTGLTCKATFTTCAQGVLAKKLAESLSADAAQCVIQGLSGAVGGGGDGDGGGSGDGGGGGGGGGKDGGTPPSCKPKTCASLGETCGTHADGCGNFVDCGTCPVTPDCTDVYEPNGAIGAAVSLGTFYDFPSTSTSINGFLKDGDEDWFSFDVGDYGFGGNPVIDLTPTDPSYEIALWLRCASGGDASTCEKGTPDGAHGKGCIATGAVRMTVECAGPHEDGLAVVRIRKKASDGVCKPYAVSIVVD